MCPITSGSLSAIQLSQQGRYVIVVRPNQTVEFRPVEVGDSLTQEMQVKKGLQAGELVVTSGQLRLQPGARVEVKEARDEKRITSANETEIRSQ